MLELVSEGCSRSDTMFMRKYCEDVYTCLVESLSLPANNVQAVEAIFTTLALIAVELISSQNVASYIALIYNLQVRSNLIFLILQTPNIFLCINIYITSYCIFL